MARITIKDLPKEIKISKEEMKRTFGGLTSSKRKTIPTGIRFSDVLRRDNPIGGIYTRMD